MTTVKTPLVIIPGLGDRVKLYKLFNPIWGLLGYEPCIFSFGWEDTNENFTTTIKRLVDYIDNLQATRVNVVGVSAGGTVAVNVLALRPHIVSRVVTVATPYRYVERLSNVKLRVSIERMRRLKIHRYSARILSMYGLYDQTVPIDASRSKYVRTQKVYAISHGCIIVTALITYAFEVCRQRKEGPQEG